MAFWSAPTFADYDPNDLDDDPDDDVDELEDDDDPYGFNVNPWPNCCGGTGWVDVDVPCPNC